MNFRHSPRVYSILDRYPIGKCRVRVEYPSDFSVLWQRGTSIVPIRHASLTVESVWLAKNVRGRFRMDPPRGLAKPFRVSAEWVADWLEAVSAGAEGEPLGRSAFEGRGQTAVWWRAGRSRKNSPWIYCAGSLCTRTVPRFSRTRPGRCRPRGFFAEGSFADGPVSGRRPFPVVRTFQSRIPLWSVISATRP